MATRYWRGTTSTDYSNINNWSDTSGGSTPATSIPTTGDTVVFDSGSNTDDCTLAGDYYINTTGEFTKLIYVLTTGGSALLILGGGFDSYLYRGDGAIGLSGEIPCSSNPPSMCDCDVSAESGCTLTGAMMLDSSKTFTVNGGADVDSVVFVGYNLTHNAVGLLGKWTIPDIGMVDLTPVFDGTGPVNILNVAACSNTKTLDFADMPDSISIDMAGDGNLTLTGNAGVSSAKIKGVILDDVTI